MPRPGWTPCWDAWSLEQDARLTELAGTLPVPELAQKLTAEFHIPRTIPACRIRAKRLGVSLWSRGLSLTQVERLFGFGHRAIIGRWVFEGHLDARRWPGRGPHPGWWFEAAELERFVRECSWLYDWRKMDPRHPLGSLAAQINRRDPWRSRADLAAYVGISEHNLGRWFRRGFVPHRRRPVGGGMQVMILSSDFPAIRERIHAGQAHAARTTREAFTAMRRAAVTREQAA